MDKLIPGGTKVEQGFVYSSGDNKEWLSIEDIKAKLLTDLDHHE